MLLVRCNNEEITPQELTHLCQYLQSGKRARTKLKNVAKYEAAFFYTQMTFVQFV